MYLVWRCCAHRLDSAFSLNIHMSRIPNRIVGSLIQAYGFFATFPFRFKSDGVQPPKDVPHSRWVEFLAGRFNKPGVRVLEIGSRNVTGSPLKSHFSNAEYVGFDFYPGDTVDVVGDAHKLSNYFVGQDRFDLIFSTAVFEHLHMPWVAAVEIQKMLKINGFLFIETHFSFSSHERPWHFFQFSDMGLRALFNESLGFELLDSGMSNPISGFFAPNADRYLRYKRVAELYCHSEIFCRKRREITGFDWNAAALDGIVGDSRYPPPEAKAAL